MKRVLQRQRSALKFLASVRQKPHQTPEQTTTKALLTPVESDNIFTTLEEDFNSMLKISITDDVANYEKRMRKLWSLILIIRRNESMLRDLNEKRGAKRGSIKTPRTSSIVPVGVDSSKAGVTTDAQKFDKMTIEPTLTMNESEMAAHKEMFEHERQNLFREILALKEKLTKNTEFTGDLNKKINVFEEQIKQLKGELEIQTSETVKELRLRQNFENRVKDLQKQIDTREKELENISYQYNNVKEQVRLLESTTNEQKLTNELLSQNNAHLSQKILKLQGDYNSQTSTLDELTQKYTTLYNQSKIYEENAAKMLNDISKNTKLKETFQKRIQLLEAQKRDLANEKEKLQAALTGVEKEAENWRRNCDNEKRNADDLKREKELLLKNFQRVNAVNDEQNRILKIEIRLKNHLESEVQRLTEEVARQNDAIKSLEKERERLKSKTVELQTNLDELRDAVTNKDAKIFELKKDLNDLDVNYKHQGFLLENVRNETNIYHQDLTRTKDEVTELRQKVKLLTQKVDEGKENVLVKENELLKEKSVLQKLERDKERLYSEIATCKETIKTTKEHMNEAQEIQKSLNNVIQKLETEIQKKDKNSLQLISERELLSTQLLQKNEEIAKLEAKLKLCETTEEKMLSERGQCLEEIQNLKSDIKRLKADKASLNRNMSTVVNLRSEVFALERELTKEKVKCRALEEELQNPLNIHRWRKLEGTDPHTYDLIIKIQQLQKCVLTKSEIAAEKDHQLKELESLYDKLKTTMANLSPAEITNRIFLLRKESEEKSKKIKSLMVEMSMYEAHAAEWKNELERKNRELEKIKTEFFKQKQSLFKMKNTKQTILSHSCEQEIQRH